MLPQITQPLSVTPSTAPSTLFSLCACANTLAYLHHYTPNWLPRGRYLAPRHLRVLAAWLGRPEPTLRTIRNHPALATHLSLLHAARLLPAEGSRLTPTPEAHTWLHASPAQQKRQLLTAASDTAHWESVLTRLGWQTMVGPDRQAFARQQLSAQDINAAPANARWLPAASDGAWRLHLPPSLPLWMRFDLHQLGNWTAPDTLHCTSLTIVQAMHNGYSERFINWLLQTATGQPLEPERAARLAHLRRQTRAYLVQPGLLLTTSRPAYLQEILNQASLRPLIRQQLSPRHALLNPHLLPRFHSWLRKQGHTLHSPPEPGAAGKGIGDAPFTYLSLRVLQGLADVTPLAARPAAALLDDAASADQLTPLQRADLDRQAQDILESLRQAVQGRDAFFPPLAPPTPEVLALVRRAIEHETLLHGVYQSLGDHQPRFRRLLPIRLEQRGELYYLHAYCYQAEAELVYRLDRFHEVTVAPATQ